MNDYALLTEQGLLAVEDMSREQLTSVIGMLVSEQQAAQDKRAHDLRFMSGVHMAYRPRYKQ